MVYGLHFYHLNSNLSLGAIALTVRGAILSGAFEGLGRPIFLDIPEQFKKAGIELYLDKVLTYDNIDIAGDCYFFSPDYEVSRYIKGDAFGDITCWLGNISNATSRSNYVENMPCKIIFTFAHS